MGYHDEMEAYRAEITAPVPPDKTALSPELAAMIALLQAAAARSSSARDGMRGNEKRFSDDLASGK